LIRKVLCFPVQSGGKINRVEICVNNIRRKQLCKSVHGCAKVLRGGEADEQLVGTAVKKAAVYRESNV
jgi:hypothetical protein